MFQILKKITIHSPLIISIIIFIGLLFFFLNLFFAFKLLANPLQNHFGRGKTIFLSIFFILIIIGTSFSNFITRIPFSDSNSYSNSYSYSYSNDLFLERLIPYNNFHTYISFNKIPAALVKLFFIYKLMLLTMFLGSIRIKYNSYILLIIWQKFAPYWVAKTKRFKLLSFINKIVSECYDNTSEKKRLMVCTLLLLEKYWLYL